MRITYAEPDRRLCLGRQNENRVTEVHFPLKELKEEFGEGTWTIVYRRTLSEQPYIVSDAAEADDHAVWTVTNADTACGGYGACELRYYVDDILKKSQLFTTVVHPSLTRETSEAPAGDEDLLDKVAKILKEIEGSTDKADIYSLRSEAWAVGQENGTDVSEGDETYHNNSKYYAERALSADAKEIDADTLSTLWYNA